jgi:hypothetical protein
MASFVVPTAASTALSGCLFGFDTEAPINGHLELFQPKFDVTVNRNVDIRRLQLRVFKRQPELERPSFRHGLRLLCRQAKALDGLSVDDGSNAPQHRPHLTMVTDDSVEGVFNLFQGAAGRNADKANEKALLLEFAPTRTRVEA